MKRISEFKPLIEGRTINNQVRIRKQRSLNLSENRNINANAVNDNKIQTCLPASRRISVKTGHLRKNVSEKELKKVFTIPSIIAYDEVPLTPKKTFHNERVYWKKRKLGNLPILLLNFEGVLGKYCKPSIPSDERATFSFREHHYIGLSRLKAEFYLVLISTYSRNATKELLNLLEDRQNLFDAIYIQRHRTWHVRHVHDVSSILDDFEIIDRSSVLAVSSIGIDLEDIKSRTGNDLVYESTASFKKKFLTYFSPTCDKELPVTVLIPHLAFNNKFQSFVDLSHFLIKFKNLDNNFFAGFDKCNALKVKTVFAAGKDRGLPVHKFLFFVRENSKAVKPSTSGFNLRKVRRVRL